MGAGSGEGTLLRAMTRLLHFAYHQAMSCIFPVAIFGTLILTRTAELPFIHRYDLILLILLTVQYLMYRSGLETLDEIKVICVFHVIGLVLEMYKIRMGSWATRNPAIRSCSTFRCTADSCTPAWPASCARSGAGCRWS